MDKSGTGREHDRPPAGHQADSAPTLELLRRARGGEQDAVDVLFGRYSERLRRWARGRLPSGARDMFDTEDLVQDVLLRTFRGLDRVEPRHEGTLQAYLRQALNNRLRDLVRHVNRRPPPPDSIGDRPHQGPSPLEEAIGRQALKRYERALARLGPDDQAAVIARVELGGSYTRLAEILDKPTADAARMAVSRALVKLAREMRDED